MKTTWGGMRTDLILFFVLAVNIFFLFRNAPTYAGWTQIANGEYYSLAIDPTNTQNIYAGSSGQVFKSTDGGASWGSTVLTGDVFSLAIDPVNTQNIYAGTDNGLYKSTDGGASWGSAILTGNISSLALDPVITQNIYAGTNNGLYKSSDGGTTWGTPFSFGTTIVNCLAINPVSPATIYAGTAPLIPGTTTGIYKSTDGGTTWNSLSISYPTAVYALAIDPVNTQTIYAGYGKGLWKSTDGGSSWSRTRLSAFRALTLTIDPENTQNLYAGAYYGNSVESGIYKSTDGGNTWNLINTGLPPEPDMSALAVDPVNSQTIYAGGPGLFEATDGGESIPSTPVGVTAYPGDSCAVVSFAPESNGGSPATFAVTSSPGGIIASGTSSPITVAGLTAGVAYTFTMTATNSEFTSSPSSASNSVTPGLYLGLPAQSSGTYGTTVQVPVSVGPLVTGLVGISFSVQFDPTLLTATGATAGTLTDGWMISSNSDASSGLINVALTNAGSGATGPGQVAILNFKVTGGGGNSTPLIFQNISLNDGGIVVTGQTGQFTVTPNASYSISGGVSYYSNGDPVEGTSLTLNGSSQTQTQTSGANGDYSFPIVPYAGDHTLTPSKTDDTGGAVSSFIGAMGASLVLQSVVESISLSPQQMIAADVNNDGQVGTMDAYYILELVVGNISLPFPNQNGRIWAFSPVSLNFTDLNTNQDNQNFSAVLIGDVSGQWSSKATATASTGRALTDSSPSLQGTSYSAANPNLSLPAAGGDPESTVLIPVTLGAANDVLAASFSVDYDPNVLTATGASLGTLDSGWLIDCNVNNPGKITVALAGSNTVSGPGQLALLEFKVNGVAGSSTTLQFSNPRLNDGQVRVVPANGSFTGPSPPSVGKPVFSSIGANGATLGATIESQGTSAVTLAGVAYGTDANPDVNGEKITATKSSGAFTVKVTGLSSNTLYHFRGYAANLVGQGYTTDTIFTTAPDAPAAGAATDVGASGFTANWTAPPGTEAITGYQLDVSLNSTFTSMLKSFKSLSVNGTSQTVPANLLTPGKTYYYRVRAVNAGGASVSSTTTTVPYLPISIVSPNGGETWTAGEQPNITWSYWGSPGSNVKIELVKGTSTLATIAASTPVGSNGSGSFPWTISNALASGSDYKVRVTSTTNRSLTAMSQGTFTITGASIAVTSPSGGETWAKGSANNITWSYSDTPGSLVNISLLNKGRVAASIARGISIGSGSYKWTVPTLSSGSTYQIQVTSTTNNFSTSTSNNFTISATETSAGPDQEVSDKASVRLSGSNSIGIGGKGASYRWSQLDGPPVTIANPSAVETGFRAQQAGESLRFQLSITDTEGATSTDNCIVNVTGDNAPPTADAGPNRKAAGFEIIELDGSKSSASDGGSLAYSWRQLSGVPVVLSEPSTAKPSFVAPDPEAGGESLVFELTVKDGAGLRSRKTCIVNVISNNPPPAVNAGSSRRVKAGSKVVLDGAGSTDESGALTFSWRQVSGRPVTLSDPTAVKPVFTAPSGGTADELVFELTVTNPAGLQDKAEVVVTIVSGALTK